MKKKIILSTVLCSAIVLTSSLTGCSLVSTNNQKDMEQVVAKVDISQSESFNSSENSLKDYKDAITSTNIVKRDLIAYFLNTGYQYVQYYGYSYEKTFNLLLDALTENSILAQYATLSLLRSKVEKDGAGVVDTYNALDSEIKKYEYLLGEDSDEVKVARYTVMSSVNSTLDTLEKQNMDEEQSTSGTETRSTPANVDKEVEHFYPKTEDGKLNYNIYTGYANYRLADSGDYQKDPIDGTTKLTRIKAYDSFIKTLKKNYLVDNSENLADTWNLKYIQNEYVSQLEHVIFEKYYDSYEDTEEGKITDDYLQKRYNELLSIQQTTYTSLSTFTSTMDGMSDTSFILYTPSTTNYGGGTFGYVYNILLPFSNAQNYQLNAAKNENDNTKEKQNAYFVTRNNILKNIETTDQRAAWFNGSTDYSFNAKESNISYYGKDNGREYLFFENNLTNNDRYEELVNYDGRYSYNGTVKANKDDTYTLIPQKLTIDGMLDEFTGYIDYVLGGSYTTCYTNSNYYKETDFYKNGSDKDVDYSKFVYANGKVNVSYNVSSLMDRSSNAYKAMAAVNELQYAYTTDTGILSKYVGYSVDARQDKTGYIKEFEYAAQTALNEGVGSFYVCAGDYGWHLIYVTATFNGGVEMTTPDWSKKGEENKGSFENLFYEWIKSSDLTNSLSGRQAQIIHEFGGNTVTKYEDAYKDLLEIKNS